MKIKKYVVSYIFLCLSLMSTSVAQDDETIITKAIKQMVEKVGSIETAEDVKKFLSYHTPNYTAIESGLLIDGSSGIKNVTLKDLEARMNRIVMNDKYQVVPKLEEINYIKILSNTAIVNTTISYSVNDGGEFLFSGSQNRTQTLVKTEEGWKIVREYIAEVRDNLQKYDCTYEVYEKDENSSILKVYYPAGDAFQSEYIDVEMEKLSSQNLLVSTDKGDQFQWDNETMIPTNARTDNGEKIKVTTLTGVYTELVRYYFSDRCVSARRSK